jgi:HEAT repeat protein
VEEAKAAQARAAEEQAQREATAAAQRAASEAEVQQRAAGIERRLKSVRGGGEMACTSALELGRMGAREAMPDLQSRLSDPSDTHLQACAAEALVALGEIEGPRAFYVSAASSSDPDLQRVALTGFASLGPAGVAEGLPFAAAGLQNPDSNHRYAAVRALGKMGRDAIPHLRTALESSDPDVKRFAQQALAAMGEH